MKKEIPIERLVSITTDGTPSMTGRHSGFIAHCKKDPDFPKIVNYHCVIHQQAICAKVLEFDHIMRPVVKIINSIRAKAKQHRSFKLFLEECAAEHGDLLLHTDVKWLSRGKILQRFLSLLGEIKTFMENRGEDTNLLTDPDWLLDLSFLTDVTEKINLLAKLGQEFSDRFDDFDKLQPCVTFMANPFMDVDVSEVSSQMAELFCVDPVETENEIINIQNNVQLKSQQQS